MAHTTQILGRCPRCEDPIPEANLLIRYESERGWPTMYAECSSCWNVVHPT